MPTDSPLAAVWRKFLGVRNEQLWHRFPGIYRAMVVDTNDPLDMHRIRFRCPDLHDWSMAREDTPWAVPAFDLGTKRQGRWAHPCVGDWVWITFERNHPYGPVWVGFANPTRRKYYPLPGVYTPTPVPVSADGTPQPRPGDYNPDYLPKDGRPMSHGWQDRYGNIDVHSSVGFFPTEHRRSPTNPGFDAVQDANFGSGQVPPQPNSPDVKYMARVTKYGHVQVMSDQGYWWQKPDDGGGANGEFTGDVVLDDAFEVARWLYLQRLLNEDDTGGDHRRQGNTTRYGHKLEMRDTGWAQPGPIDSMSRPGEYAEPRHLSQERVNDYRWIKIRSGGGMLWQAYDKGCDPSSDTFVQRLLIDEVAELTEREDLYWANKDARQIRSVTRYGIKIVQDDRGTDPTAADQLESPRANGVLIKGRRTGGSVANKTRTGDPRGFYWEFNENDDANHTTWGTPLGMVAELNDATEYVALAAGIGGDYAMPWQGLQENEFLRNPVRSADPESNAHHLVLDLENEYVRLKTRAGGGDGPDDPTINPTGTDVGSLNQGLEARDGSLGDGPWTEVVDSEDRGLWLSKQFGVGVWRAKQGSNMFICQEDRGTGRVIIYQGGGGRIQIYCNGPVELSGNTVTLQASNDLNLRASGTIRLDAGGAQLTLNGAGIQTSGQVRAASFQPGAAGGEVVPPLIAPTPPAQLEPSDRGATYNTPSVVSDAEIEHPIA